MQDAAKLLIKCEGRKGHPDMLGLRKFTSHIPFLRNWAGSNEKKY